MDSQSIILKFMQRKRPDVDVIKNVLEEAVKAYPHSTFIRSLSFQYQERGGLSKKQLEGLYQKSKKIKTLPSKWLATLEAEILKKSSRYKSAAPPVKPLYEKNEKAGQMIADILQKFPQHKRVIYLKTVYDRHQTLSAVEMAELEKFRKLLL